MAWDILNSCICDGWGSLTNYSYLILLPNSGTWSSSINFDSSRTTLPLNVPHRVVQLPPDFHSGSLLMLSSLMALEWTLFWDILAAALLVLLSASKRKHPEPLEAAQVPSKRRLMGRGPSISSLLLQVWTLFWGLRMETVGLKSPLHKLGFCLTIPDQLNILQDQLHCSTPQVKGNRSDCCQGWHLCPPLRMMLLPWQQILTALKWGLKTLGPDKNSFWFPPLWLLPLITLSSLSSYLGFFFFVF